MSVTFPITTQYFSKRLVDLCLRSGLAGLPRDEADQNILLKSAALALDPAAPFTEKEINDRLRAWIDGIGQENKMDHGTIRRALVDNGFVSRASDGSSYQVRLDGPRPGYFEEAVNQLDGLAIIEAAREEIARRKREFMQKSGH